MERKPEEERNFRMLGLLTSKPVLYVCNVEESSAATGNSFSQAVFDHAKKEGAVAVVISSKDRIRDRDAVTRGARRLPRYARTGRSRARSPDPRRL
jgi:hypothetical protein